MKALVTGANGFVGYWVAKELVNAGFEVRALVRSEPTAHLKQLEMEIVQGDLCDGSSLAIALKGCDYLFHVAAHYTLWERDPKLFYEVNVEGTKRLFSLAQKQNIQKIVYTSSVAAIKLSLDGTPVDETSEARLSDIVGHYKKSKFLAEQAVLEMAQHGLPVIIVNPSTPVGAYDIKPTPTGKIIVDFLKGKMPAYVDTGLNLVAVEDVAKGHLLAAEKGEFGKRYILGNKNLELIEIFRILEKISGVKAPKIKMPYWIAYSAGAVSEIWAKLSDTAPAIPLDGVRMSRKRMFFESSRAKMINFQPGSVEDALERAVHWFQENGYV